MLGDLVCDLAGMFKGASKSLTHKDTLTQRHSLMALVKISTRVDAIFALSGPIPPMSLAHLCTPMVISQLTLLNKETCVN